MIPVTQLEPRDQIPCELEIRSFSAIQGVVWCVNGNGTVTVREVATAKESFQVTRYDRDVVWCLDAVPGTEQGSVWLGYSSGAIRVYSALGTHLNDITHHRGGVTAIRSHNDMVFSGDQHSTIVQWCAVTKANLQTFQGHTGPIRALVVTMMSPSGLEFHNSYGAGGAQATRTPRLCLLSGSDDCSVRKWLLDPPNTHSGDIRTAQVPAALGDVVVLHNGPVQCLAVAVGNLWSGGEETRIRVTSLDPPHRAITLTHQAIDHSPSCLYQPPQTELIFAANVDRTVILWDAANMVPLYTLSNSKQGYVHSLASVSSWMMKSLTMWTSATDGTLHRWSVSVPVTSNEASSPVSASVRTRERDDSSNHAELRALRSEVLKLRERESTFHQRITSVQRMIEQVEQQREEIDRRHQQEIQRIVRAAELIPAIERKAMDAIASARALHDGTLVVSHLRELLELIRSKPSKRETSPARRSHSSGVSRSATSAGAAASKSSQVPTSKPRPSIQSILSSLNTGDD